VSDFEFVLCDLSRLCYLAQSDRSNEVVVGVMRETTFVVFLRGVGKSSRIALSAPHDAEAMRLFVDLEECVRTAIGIAPEGHVFFDKVQVRAVCTRNLS